MLISFTNLTLAHILAALTMANLESALGVTVTSRSGKRPFNLSWYFCASPTVSTYTYKQWRKTKSGRIHVIPTQSMCDTHVMCMWYPHRVCVIHVIPTQSMCDTHVLSWYFCASPTVSTYTYKQWRKTKSGRIRVVCMWYLHRVCVIPMCCACDTHTEYVWYPCGMHVIPTQSMCDTHVVCMWYPHRVCVISVCCACDTHTEFVWYPCVVHVIPTQSLCDTHALCMWYPHRVCVIPMRCACDTHTEYVWYPCVVHVIPTQSMCDTHVLSLYFCASPTVSTYTYKQWGGETKSGRIHVIPTQSMYDTHVFGPRSSPTGTKWDGGGLAKKIWLKPKLPTWCKIRPFFCYFKHEIQLFKVLLSLKVVIFDTKMYIHTYKDIYKAPFDQKDTKRYRKRKNRWGKKKKRQEPKKKGNQLIGKNMTFKRLFEGGSGGSASDHGREVVP